MKKKVEKSVDDNKYNYESSDIDLTPERKAQKAAESKQNIFANSISDTKREKINNIVTKQRRTVVSVLKSWMDDKTSVF